MEVGFVYGTAQDGELGKGRKRMKQVDQDVRAFFVRVDERGIVVEAIQGCLC